MIHQQEASWRLATPIHLRQPASMPPPPLPEPEADLSKVVLPDGWIGLPDCVLQNSDALAVAIPLALLHPEFGVALLGVPEEQGAAVETALRRRLDAARFVAIFPGHLPVVTLAMMPGEPLNLQRRLAAAFASLPPLDLAGGDGWVAVVRRAMLSRSPMRLVRPGLEAANLPRRQATTASQPLGPRGWVWPMAGITVVAMVVGVLLGMNNPAGESSPASTGTDTMPQPSASAVAPPQVNVLAPQASAPLPSTSPAPPRPSAMSAAPVPAPVNPPVAAAPVATSSPPRALPRVLVRSPANLRTAPDTGARVLRTAPRGEAFRVHGEVRGWIQVGDATPEGWIYAGLLSDPSP